MANENNSVNIQDHIDAFKFRLKLCNRTLTVTNMILAYTKLEDIFVYYYKNNMIKDLRNLEDRIQKFDKIKNLALVNKELGERRAAFDRSIIYMDKTLGGGILL